MEVRKGGKRRDGIGRDRESGRGSQEIVTEAIGDVISGELEVKK